MGSLDKRKQRGAPSQATANNVAAVAKTGFATTSRMHRRHSSSDDRLAPSKEDVRLKMIRLL